MQYPRADLLDVDRGAITAPAGCGKTELIARTLKLHAGSKPILVLTHTNAGVAALRARLDASGVPAARYRLLTIDGWAIRLASTFPLRTECKESTLRLANPREDYPNIRLASAKLLKAGHINDLLAATYARLIVDEYQDCSIRQHAIVAFASAALPTCVLGDPLQAIFNFGSDELANWDAHVCTRFPVVEQLSTPWRWINAGAEPLGRWLLKVRQDLLGGVPIDLRAAPEGVRWVELTGAGDHPKLLEASRVKAMTTDGSVLIIGDSMNVASRNQIASAVPGTITVEAVDLRDLVNFANTLDFASPDALETIVRFAQSVMSNVGGSDLLQRVRTLREGRARKAPTTVEAAALSFLPDPSPNKTVELLVEIGKQTGVRKYRPLILRAAIRALNMCSGADSISFADAAIRVREQNRIQGRPLPRRAIGSTLLLKGLEADTVVILNAGELDARNLYVAMTRGARAVVLCSSKPVLNPARPS
jgi:hypothetical protein